MVPSSLSRHPNRKQPAASRYRRCFRGWLLSLMLLLAGCSLLPPAATGMSSGLGLSFQYSQDPSSTATSFAQVLVKITDPAPDGYRVTAMPMQWDTAVITLSGPLPASQVKTLAKVSFTNNATQAAFTAIPPGNNFSLNVKLYDGGAFGTLVSEGTQAIPTLVAGPQTITVTMVTPYLTSLNPAIAEAGSTLTLYGGGFGGSTVVTFPGAGDVTVTPASTQQLQVTVPAGATEGSLRVTTNGITTNSLSFRGIAAGEFTAPASFGYDSHTLVGTRRGQVDAILGKYLYLIGGDPDGNTAGTMDTVERAPINADGSLGNFEDYTLNTGVKLNASRRGHTIAVFGNNLYIIGGTAGGTLPPGLTSIERATFDPVTGTLGAFTTLSATLRSARYAHGSAVIGDYLYVLGGISGLSNLNSVERAKINSDGTLGAFTAYAASTLTQARGAFTIYMNDKYLYAIGGSAALAAQKTVDRASIDLTLANPLGTFSTTGISQLTTARDQPCSNAFGGYVYAIAGTSLTTIERAPINANGTLGTWAAYGVSLNKARQQFTTEIFGQTLYVFGGKDTSSTATNTIEKAGL